MDTVIKGVGLLLPIAAAGILAFYYLAGRRMGKRDLRELWDELTMGFLLLAVSGGLLILLVKCWGVPE